MAELRAPLAKLASRHLDSAGAARWRTYQLVFVIASLGMLPLIFSGQDRQLAAVWPLVALSVGFAALAIVQGIVRRVSPLIERVGFAFGALMYFYRFVQVSYLIGIGQVGPEALGDIFPWAGVIYAGAFVVFTQRQALLAALLTMVALGLAALLLLVSSPYLRALEPTIDLMVASAIMILLLSISRRMVEAGARAEARAELLQQLAIRDSLTGLYNRRYLDERLAEEFVRAVRYQHPLSVAVIDIDGFKAINDRFSHELGDHTLKVIAELLRQSVREADIVARLGGEEFVVVLLETPLEGARRVCEVLRQKVATYDWGQLHPQLSVTVSVGVSAELAVASHQQLLHLADVKLYEAKRQGKNRVCA